MGPSESHYVHGTTPDEQRRLSLLNDLLNDASLRQMGLEGGSRILDVGSGLGQFSRAMARRVRPANFLGVLGGARAAIREEVPDAEIDRGIEALRGWAERPAAALWYATCWAEGVRDGRRSRDRKGDHA